MIIQKGHAVVDRHFRSVPFGIGGFLLVIALVNIFGTLTPVNALNDRIDMQLTEGVSLPVAERLTRFNKLKQEQVGSLRYKPSDPYSWSRLSYLRMATEGNQAEAFAALRVSDLVSPYEALQLPERSVTWLRFRSVETPEQQAYQDQLWQKAFAVAPDTTWKMAQQNKLTKDLGEALKKLGPGLYDKFQDYEQGLIQPVPSPVP